MCGCVHTHRATHTHTHIYIYIYMYTHTHTIRAPSNSVILLNNLGGSHGKHDRIYLRSDPSKQQPSQQSSATMRVVATIQAAPLHAKHATQAVLSRERQSFSGQHCAHSPESSSASLDIARYVSHRHGSNMRESSLYSQARPFLPSTLPATIIRNVLSYPEALQGGLPSPYLEGLSFSDSLLGVICASLPTCSVLM